MCGQRHLQERGGDVTGGSEPGRDQRLDLMRHKYQLEKVSFSEKLLDVTSSVVTSMYDVCGEKLLLDVPECIASLDDCSSSVKGRFISFVFFKLLMADLLLFTSFILYL